MLKKDLIKLMLIIGCLFIIGCGKEKEDPDPINEPEIKEEKGNEEPTENPEEPTEEKPSENNQIVKITGAADKEGIYTIVVTLKEGAAPKGVIELTYYGAKGTPQENDVVNRFRIEYYQKESGKYEASTYYDGNLYSNYHDKDQLKVNNTFGATLRAGLVVITYTPDGGETIEIYKAEANELYAE